MPKELLSRAEKYVNEIKYDKYRKCKIGIASCLVAAITVSQLILPAITMGTITYCGVDEHHHDESCYEMVLICGMEEGEQKEETSEPKQILERKVETTNHTHTDTCYKEEQLLICTLEETQGHIHTQECLPAQNEEETEEAAEEELTSEEIEKRKHPYICGLNEGDGSHFHEEACYEIKRELICELPEGEIVTVIEEEQPEELPTEDSHMHTDACWEKRLICEKEEHEHSLICYSDPNADIETAADWERTLSAVVLTGNMAEDLILTAKSQLGYHESTNNYIVTEDGKKKGITRYGQWYGNAYGDWCAMFVSFCLNYAGIGEEQMPYEASCERWKQILTDNYKGKYIESGTVLPSPGDILFFDWDNDQRSDHVGIISEIDEAQQSITTIEGNSSNKVQEVKYTLSDETILGYGLLEARETQLKSTYVYEDDFMIVTAVLEKADAIPDEAVFIVNPIDESAGNIYDTYMQELEEEGTDSLLYDMGFYVEKDGLIEECEPEEGEVSISFVFKDQQLTQFRGEKEADIQVIHMPLREESVMKEYVPSEISENEISFSLTEFSLVAFIKNEGQSKMISSESQISPGPYMTIDSILGEAKYFGNTADTINLKGHSDTTLAVKKIISQTANITCGMYTNENYGGSYIIADIDNMLRIDGKNTLIYTTQQAREKLELLSGTQVSIHTKSTLEDKVDAMLQYAQQQSDYMNEQTTYDVVPEDQNNRVIDLTAYDAGTYYLDGDRFTPKQSMQIKKKADQILVFNCRNAEISMNQFFIQIEGENESVNSATTSEKAAEIAKTIIFNCPNAQKVNIQSGIFGIILAPRGEIVVGSTSSGWTVSKSISNPGGEWHYMNQELPGYVEVQLEAEKLVNGICPKESEIFEFELEYWENERWNQVAILKNTGTKITCSEIFERPGTHYYRLSEKAGTDLQYRYDPTSYIIKVDISEIIENGHKKLIAVKTYYKSDEIGNSSNNSLIVSKATFNNMLSEEQPFVFPETGGEGVQKYITGGALLIGTFLFFIF